MAQPYPVVGAEGTGCHPRLDLRDFQKNPIQFSLFIRAVTKLKAMKNTGDESSPDYCNKPNSWWQLAGIHGLPYMPWSGDPDGPQKRVTTGKKWGGYCYHGAALFPQWHRLYTLLAEQVLVNEAIAIATEFERKNDAARKEKWLQAASELRLPFWDWTQPETAEEGIPKIFIETMITIVEPGGRLSQVSNPLTHYEYPLNPLGTGDGIEYMRKWTRTYRWVDNPLNPTKEMYNQSLKAFSQGGLTLKLGTWSILQLQPVSWLREKIGGLFAYDMTVNDSAFGPNMWGYFSNAGAHSVAKVECPMAIVPPSLEEPHNMIHMNVGGNGSMTTSEYAGFDPIFFLHHSNIDRIYSFWEYLYPDYWIGNGWKNSQTGQTIPFLIDDGNFDHAPNAVIDHTTPLLPFRKKDLTYWTPDDTRGMLPSSSFNGYYTYPPITDHRTGTIVRVDVPYDANDLSLRRRYRQALFNEWGPDLHAIVQAHWDLPVKLPFLDLLLRKENGLLHLRQFAVVGLLPEFAFSGSYRLELYLLPKVVQVASAGFRQPPGLFNQATGLLKYTSSLLWQAAGLGLFQQKQETYVVNNITVFGRSDPERCAACRERRAAGKHVRGHMHLDPRVILYLLASLDPGQLGSITGLDQLADVIERSFGVRLMAPDGKRLACAEPGVSCPSTVEECKLPKLSLHSYIITFDPSDPIVPIEFNEHANHGTFGRSHGWF